MVAVVEVLVRDLAHAAGALGDVLAGHFEMHAARIDAFGRPLGESEPALRDPPHAPAFLGQLFAAREVHVRLFEERDVVVAGIHIAPRRREQAFEERRSENGLLARERLLQRDTARRQLLR